MNATNPTVLVRQTSRITFLLLFSFVCCIVIACSNKKPIANEDLPPWSTVIELYEQEWNNEQSAFFNPDETNRSFAPPLANLIHVAVNRDKMASLKFNPLYHTNNKEIKNLKIARPVYLAADQSSVEVTFFNINEPVKIQVDVILMQTGAWKITNIRYPDNTDLISILIN